MSRVAAGFEERLPADSESRHFGFEDRAPRRRTDRLTEAGSRARRLRPAAPSVSEKPAAALLLAATFLVMGCGPRAVRPDQPVPLAYGGATAETRSWALEQVFRGEVAFGMLPQLVVIRITGTLEETVLEVLNDGRRKVRQRWSFNPPELNGMKITEGGPTRSEVAVLRAPTGAMTAGEGAAPQADLIAWAARVLGGVFPQVPESPVAAGVWWDRSETLRPGEGVEVTATQRARLAGVEPGRVARLETEGAIALAKPAPGGMLEEFRVAYTGEARLGLASGWLDRSEHSGTLNVKGRSGKAPIIARLRFTGTLTPVR